ncbi:MAG TPA: acyl-CoA dehydrogenase [Sneathiellales bacterium]|jgi:acyl-CoA dehydrogenase|nr:acyl-CoA dehydrogenase [Sneathiellales bacterium]
MSYSFTPEQEQIREAVLRLCARFDEHYWLDRDTTGEFPEDFCRALSDEGWIGVAMSEQYGGSGLGTTEAAIVVQAISESGAAASGVSAVALGLFGVNPMIEFGTEEQKREFLPRIIRRDDIACFGVTEPDAGLDTTRLKTRAVRDGNNYKIYGQKIWTSTAQVANKIMLIARTTPENETEKPIDGLSLFYTDLNRDYADVQLIEKMGRKCVDSNSVFFDGMPVPAEHLIGEEGKGFRYLLSGLNAERILVAAGLVGLGRVALKRATDYANERVVFGRPIGMNQSIQHPLAANWAQLEAANLMVFKAASLYDKGEPCGAEANAAKYLAGEAAFETCTNAVTTHGGLGYAKEYHVERYLREVLIHRLAPISPQLILCYLAERVLGLPKSY